MTIEEAIKKAIEGGWKTPFAFEGWPSEIKANLAFLDPKFWQALGKAMGGEVAMEVWTQEWGNDLKIRTGWEAMWHQFIDHLAEGKNPEEFFSQLV